MDLVALHYEKAILLAERLLHPEFIRSLPAAAQSRLVGPLGVASDIGEHGCWLVLAALCALYDAHNRYMVSAIVSCSRDRYGWAADHFCQMLLTAPACTPKTSCSIWCCRTTYSRHRKASLVVLYQMMIIGLGMLAEQLCRSCCACWWARKGAHLHRKVAVRGVFSAEKERF